MKNLMKILVIGIPVVLPICLICFIEQNLLIKIYQIGIRVVFKIWIGCLQESFNQPINTHTITRSDGSRYKAWDVSNVTNMGWMFSSAKAFDQDISNWNVSNARYVAHMFDGATAMLRKLPHLQRRNPRGTPNANDWKADMYPRDKLFNDYKKSRDNTKFVRDLMNRMIKKS